MQLRKYKNENALNCYLNAGFKIIDIEKMFSNFMMNTGIVLKWLKIK